MAVLHIASWNLRGKNLEDLARVWDLVGLAGTEVFALQELGGLPSRCPSHDTIRHHGLHLAGRSFTFFYCDPSHSFRGSAIGVPSDWVHKIDHKTTFSTGLGVTLKNQGVRQFLMTAHLPHDLRADCLSVWQSQVDEILDFTRNRRYHDLVCLCADLNYDILDIVSVDERGVPFEQLLRDLGLSHSKPTPPTWSNTRGSQSRLDFLLFSLPSMIKSDDRVHVGSDDIVGSDHCAVSISLHTVGRSGRRRFQNSKCGKWRVDAPNFAARCETLAEDLDLSCRDLDMSDIEAVCSKSCRRITSCRYTDGPDIRAMIQKRKSLRGAPARSLAKEIADARKVAKQKWLTGLLEQGAAGDFRALSYFRKRNSAAYTHGSYCMRAGGGAKAISDLRIFYKNKYTPAHPVPRGLSMAIFRHRTGPVFNPEAFTLQEIQAVAFLCRHNKSTGADGVSYEAIQLLLQTGLSTNLLEMFNTVLWGLRQVPPSWLSSHVTFLPKTSAPSSPGELRPIVLSPTVAKVFTKALMLRLRSRLPPIRACQVGGIAGRQTLDSVCAVQHAIKLAEEYNKTLFVIKLDITAAFDSLSHEALAAFLAEASGCREAELLLEIITNTRVTLSMQGTTWEQALSQGVLQGSSYSAELFARCVDYYLAKTNASWQEHEVTWLQSSDGRKMFLTPFADDLIILGASRDQAQRLLRDTEDTLNAIGLHFNAKKCRFLRPPGMSDRPLHLRNGQPVQAQDSLIFPWGAPCL